MRFKKILASVPAVVLALAGCGSESEPDAGVSVSVSGKGGSSHAGASGAGGSEGGTTGASGSSTFPGTGGTAGAGQAGGSGSAGQPGTGGSAGAGTAGTNGQGGGASGSTGSGGSGGDPCATAKQSSGEFCGSTLGSPDASTLFHCENFHVIGATPCLSGCHPSTTGSDYCEGTVNPADPCSAASEDGAYCGASLGAGADGSSLYQCQAKKTLGSIHCDSGCVNEAAGTPDHCSGVTSDPCAKATGGSGAYCGASIGADASTLYTCQGTTTAGTTHCNAGCHQSPAGQADYCESASASDPCQSASSGNGDYCGASLGGGDASTLYNCQNGKTAKTTHCDSGCNTAPPGKPDTCNTGSSGGDPCKNASSGNGAYCGSPIGGDANTLYNCQSGATAGTTKCSGGCVVAPPGQPDACSGSSTSDPCKNASSGNGAYCGASISGDPSTLYNCQSGKTASSTHCDAGCQVAPPGKPDACAASSGDPCAKAGAGNGAYCGGAIGGDANTLYDCQSGKTASSTHCDNGCSGAPSGQPDFCTPAPGTGTVSCKAIQWWNASITYGPYSDYNPGQGVTYWWDTDLGVGASTPVQLRHDSKLVAAGVHAWGWQPTFVDQQTGKMFQFLHLRPQNQYTTAVGTVYPAGTIVGLSGGDTADTGYPKYSSGAHLCLQTVDTWAATFPAGQDACQ